MSVVGPPTDDAEQPQRRRIEGKQFVAPYQAAVELIGYQQPFPLTDGDFLRLKHKPNSILITLTGALWGSGVTQGLPLLIGFLRKEAVSGANVLMAVGFLAAGFVTLGFSILLNKTRKRVMQKIERHFEDNPGDFGYWMKGP